MSRSPGRSYARVSSLMLAQLQAEQAKREAEAAARLQRRLEEARRLAVAREAFALEADSLATKLLEAMDGKLGERLSPSVAPMMVRLGKVRSEVELCRDPNLIPGHFEKLRALDNELRSAILEAHAASSRAQVAKDQSNQVAAIRAELELMELQLGSSTDATERRYDLKGHTSASRAIASIRGMLESGQINQARVAVSNARSLVQAHIQQAHREKVADDTRRREWRDRLDELDAQLMTLADDEVATAWVGPEIERLKEARVEMTAHFDAGRWDRLRLENEAIKRAIEKARNDANAQQLEARKRAYLVESLMEVMAAEGFMVGAPQLASSDDYRSAVVIHAIRPDERAVWVDVPLGGELVYEVDGYASRTVARGDEIYTTCEEGEEQLNAFRERLRADFEIETTEVAWDDGDPLRTQKNAQSLPSEGSASVPSVHKGDMT